MTLSRRRFLTLAGGAAAGAAAGGAVLWPRLVEESVTTARAGAARAGRLLVVVELAGGNDGLDTLVPLDGRYQDARGDLALPEGDLVTLGEETAHGLHPALAPLEARGAAGQVAVVAGIGIEGQSRSHFQATDTWSRGTAQRIETGWLGRWLDATGGPRQDPLRAVALGGRTTSLVGEQAVATHVFEPAQFRLAALPGAHDEVLTAALVATAEPLTTDAVPATDAAPATDAVLAEVRAATPAALTAVDVLTEATTADGDTLAALGQGRQADGRATALLEVAAQIVALELGTQVLVVTVPGFDTHVDQPRRHAGLLGDVATGIERFLAAMDDHGRAEDVLVVTTSEFGRRIVPNAGRGTDHGYGSVALAAGAGVAGGVVGDLGLDRPVDGDLPVTVDTRSLYAAALDWLGGPTDEVLDGSWDRLGLLT